jgi:succinate dehydrogenase/fumarate reductase flavoprotein subunit
MEGKPIPRLYAAGELGSFFGHLYQGGNNLPEALAFGRIAGERAAAENSW